MARDIIPYDPYHPHLGYTLAVTCLAWFSIGLYSRRHLQQQPHTRMALFAFTIGLPIATEVLTYLIDVLRPAPDTPVGYVLSHLHAYVIQRIPIDSFLSPAMLTMAIGVLGALLVISLARYTYGSVQLNRRLAGAIPIARTRYRYLMVRLVAATPAHEPQVPPVLVQEHALPLALTTGLLAPRIYVTTGLLDLLDDNEALAVLCHEWAHVQRHDNLWNWLIRLLRDVLWFLPGTHLAWRQMVSSQEEACDVLAVQMTRQPLALARALVKVARALSAAKPMFYETAAPFAMAKVTPRVRVEQMIRLNNGQVPASGLPTAGGYALAVALLFLALLPALLGS